MKKFAALATACSLLLVGCSESDNTLSQSETSEGWELLFDGETLSGWTGYMGAPIEDAWSVKDGVLSLKGGSPKGSYVNIRTETEADDFELKWDWKIEPGSNSGLMFHVKEGPKMPYLTGPEYQILDNEGFRGGKGEPVTKVEYTASHYAIEEAFEDMTNPIGEWNSSRIKVVGNHVQFFLNGTLTADYTMHSEKWNKQIANAKFSKWKLFATTGEGHIALQDHGQAAYFKNIKLKRL
ncbi:3-keto-disaccharide hydrolase [Pelagicoccus mobilis]|uniref:DUF1080 domain-containing protein n=1 Tax=Pelagicoccus mobilis TaxID=415221 RepID=A0A934VQG9_9BACT|nr:DUF1080 domain-containing protein [Pelagicoccus mobilis]MBK1876484.1 DUF1080 domain-containing protein [Pelagicoccus mobilis]